MISCSKDNETLRNLVEETNEASTDADEIKEVNNFEERIDSFYIIQDAHIIKEKAYNEQILRLQKNNNSSYLLFDLSPIDSIKGEIENATLHFSIDSDEGNGEITIYQGSSSDWDERSLNFNNAPKHNNVSLGSINKEFKTGQNDSILLTSQELKTSLLTLVLKHEGDNDVGIASKENRRSSGPSLKVKYKVAINTEEITIPSIRVDQTSQEATKSSPIAVAEADTLIGHAPFKVEFNAAGSNTKRGTLAYRWNFMDDSDDSLEMNTSHTFLSAGVYEVILTVENEEGLSNYNSIEINVLKSENNAPQAVIKTSKVSGTVPLEISFNSEDSTSENGPLDFYWQFNDSTETSNSANPIHTFTNEGVFEVTLTVTDSIGLTNSSSTTITVLNKDHENEAPISKPQASITSGEVPLVVNFNGSDSTDDFGIKTYEWDFKDGNSSNNKNITHVFEEIGVYQVSLKVTDSLGLSDIEITEITVTEKNEEETENAAPIAKFTTSLTSGNAPIEIEFDGSTSTDDFGIKTYEWDFKDGNRATTQIVNHTFVEAGVYEVSLTVIDSMGLSAIETREISILEEIAQENNPPVAKLTVSTTSGDAPLEIEFNGNESTDDNGVTGYNWDFKDGSTSSEQNPSHVFENAGEYRVSLTVNDEQGLQAVDEIVITVNEVPNTPPVSIIEANNFSGNAPFVVQFDGSNSNDDKGITSYEWEFDDGTMNATIVNPQHTFTEVGNYNVKLTVTDIEGLENFSSVNISVSPTDTGNAPQGSYFVTTNGSSSNDGLSEAAAWNIEHAFENAQAGDYVYIKAGNYGNVNLQVGNSGNAGSPIRFIGYKSVPGDVIANSGSTFSYGESVDPTKMPLLSGQMINDIGQGRGIYSFTPYIEFSNIQITNYEMGIWASGINNKLDNIIVTEVGDFNYSNSYQVTNSISSNYKGIGINVNGDYSEIKNCFVLNAGAEGFKFQECEYQKHSYNKVYSNNLVNGTDYYYLLTLGANNNELDNIYVERSPATRHPGHGLVLKFQAENNTITNSTVKNSWFEFSYSGVMNNTIRNSTSIGVSEEDGTLLIANGANNNTFYNCLITKNGGVSFSDWDEDFSRGDVRDAGHHNTFFQCEFKDMRAGINFWWWSTENTEVSAHNNTFEQCTFTNLESLFLIDRANENNLLKDCTINNVTQLKDHFYPTIHSNIELNAIFENNTVNNSGFSLN